MSVTKEQVQEVIRTSQTAEEAERRVRALGYPYELVITVLTPTNQVAREVCSLAPRIGGAQFADGSAVMIMMWDEDGNIIRI